MLVPSFVDDILRPEFNQFAEALREYLDEATKRIIREVVFRDLAEPGPDSNEGSWEEVDNLRSQIVTSMLEPPLAEALRELAASWCAEVLKLEVKDLVFPGEMKQLHNQVIAAEMKAATQVIRAGRSGLERTDLVQCSPQDVLILWATGSRTRGAQLCHSLWHNCRPLRSVPLGGLSLQPIQLIGKPVEGL